MEPGQAQGPSLRLGNLPVPQANLLGIAAGYGLQRVCPWMLPGSRSLRSLVGWPLFAAGAFSLYGPGRRHSRWTSSTPSSW